MTRFFLLPLLLLVPLAAGAGALSDLLMAPGVFAAAPAGTRVVYSEERTVPGEGSLADVVAARCGSRWWRRGRGAS
jgi:hypothetical protein